MEHNNWKHYINSSLFFQELSNRINKNLKLFVSMCNSQKGFYVRIFRSDNDLNMYSAKLFQSCLKST